jgi:hypothetical protein
MAGKTFQTNANIIAPSLLRKIFLQLHITAILVLSLQAGKSDNGRTAG